MNRAPTSAMAQTMIMAGCMVIADAISLFHPLLNEALLQSAIVANERVAIFIHNPINSQSIEINDIIKKHVNEKVRLAFDRFDTQLDKLCEFGLGGVLTLRRWLNAVVPDMEKFVNPREDNRQSMCEIEGNPRGVGQLFYPLGRENVRS